MKTSPTFETFVQQVAERYRADGYEVLVQPAPSRRPSFLRKYSPDFIVRRGNERAVVEIKRMDRPPVGAQLRRMAELVESKPGWRFDLVLYSPEEGSSVKPPTKQSIRRSIAQARKLYGAGDKPAAILLAWSGFEAASRRAIEDVEGAPIEGGTPSDILKTLLSHGLITEPQWKKLDELLRLRNAVAHGGIDRPIQKRLFERLCNHAEHLIDSRSLASAAV